MNNLFQVSKNVKNLFNSANVTEGKKSVFGSSSGTQRLSEELFFKVSSFDSIESFLFKVATSDTCYQTRASHQLSSLMQGCTLSATDGLELYKKAVEKFTYLSGLTNKKLNNNGLTRNEQFFVNEYGVEKLHILRQVKIQLLPLVREMLESQKTLSSIVKARKHCLSFSECLLSLHDAKQALRTNIKVSSEIELAYLEREKME
jgi:hypothetical protein